MGTTPADEVASAPFIFPATPNEVTLFSGLTLPHGTYYRTLIGINGTNSGWIGTEAAIVTTAPGVILNSDVFAVAPNVYAPASSFMPTSPLAPTNLSLRVTAGNAVPETPSLAELMIAGGAIALMLRKAALARHI